ncbi:hypothetical protein B5C26_09415 [Photorhabdus luminescens]|uniref:Uncharacterized protein n=1 Tax=Photorhabdus luminescens subsp. mexicana TaxID=2100167 RepID=A0A4R4JGV6_PHOLU|nr:hypothetical protein [Photorhabdus luminescens]OWO82586.1 hypothetical protein B5C26_09415 [Photorhabdus luminescens]TDB52852.1 hypothetical protein C5468_07830 [Photorhabdus luminescens subsp. mexicana]
MASVTTIKTIENITGDTMVIINGEDSNIGTVIERNRYWHGSLRVPWIGDQSESWKALRIFVLGGYRDIIWVFQDYYRPPGENAIKYCVGEFSYKNAQEIQGNNRGGGDKIFRLSAIHGQVIHSIKLEMI